MIKVEKPKKYRAVLSKADYLHLIKSLKNVKSMDEFVRSKSEQLLLDERRRLIRGIQYIRDSISDPSWQCIEDILELVAKGRK